MTRNNIMWQHFTVVQRNSVTHCMQFDKENAEGSLNVTGPASSSATGTKLRDHCLGWRLCVCLLECVHPHVTSTPSITPLVPCLSPLVSQTLAPSLHTLAFFLPLFPSRYLVCVIVYGSLSHPGSSPIWPQRRASPFHHHNSDASSHHVSRQKCLHRHQTASLISLWELSLSLSLFSLETRTGMNGDSAALFLGRTDKEGKE